MTDLSLLRPCCLLNFLLRDEITRAAAPNAPEHVRHVVGFFFFFSSSFPFTAAAMTIEGNDSGPLGKFDAEHAGTVERDRFLYVQYQITTVKAALPDRIDA